MCYDNNALPPDAPGEIGKATGKELELISADGTHFAAYAAHCEGKPASAQVVIYPDVRGLHQFYKELALRFAEKGIDAVAIDYFGRTAGLGPRDDSFDFMAHVPLIEMPTFLADVRAALGYLKSSETSSSRATFTLGFCMGGTLSLLTGTEELGLAGIIAFYAGMTRKFPGSGYSALEKADQVRYPVLGLFGGADQGIPASAVEELDSKLAQAGVEHEIIVYPGAPHSFFDRKAVEFAEASADAWEHVLNFVAAHA